MTRQETAELLKREAELRPIKEAFVRGEEIQGRLSIKEEWDEVTTPYWISDYHYRIKPKTEPRVPKAGDEIQVTREGKWENKSFHSLEDGSVWCYQGSAAMVNPDCLERYYNWRWPEIKEEVKPVIEGDTKIIISTVTRFLEGMCFTAPEDRLNKLNWWMEELRLALKPFQNI